jgi:hypothetical protein
MGAFPFLAGRMGKRRRAGNTGRPVRARHDHKCASDRSAVTVERGLIRNEIGIVAGMAECSEIVCNILMICNQG